MKDITTAKIYEMAGQAFDLAERGARWNRGEIELLATSLRLNDLKQCEALIKTLGNRLK